MKKILGKYRVRLVRGGFRRGIGTGLRQLWLVLADALWQRKRLYFYADAKEVACSYPAHLPPLGLQQITDLTDMPPSVLDAARTPGSGYDLGDFRWLALGWRLWLARIDDEPVGLAWVRNGGQSKDYFHPIPDGAALMWHIHVFPGHEGKHLYHRIWDPIFDILKSEGVRDFYVMCRAYNTPSQINILRCGFRQIGTGGDNLWSKRTTLNLNETDNP